MGYHGNVENRKKPGKASVTANTWLSNQSREEVRLTCGSERGATSRWMREAIIAWCDLALIDGVPGERLPCPKGEWHATVVISAELYARLGLAARVAGLNSTSAGMRAAITAAVRRA